LLRPFSHVLRECVEEEVPAEELVMGDIIFMKAGDIVPADSRILESNGFTVDNSVITGESEPYELVSFGVGFLGQLPKVFFSS
jgi:P-type E1-E2 ATPase